jgi:hypothetical protein
LCLRAEGVPSPIIAPIQVPQMRAREPNLSKLIVSWMALSRLMGETHDQHAHTRVVAVPTRSKRCQAGRLHARRRMKTNPTTPLNTMMTPITTNGQGLHRSSEFVQARPMWAVHTTPGP